MTSLFPELDLEQHVLETDNASNLRSPSSVLSLEQLRATSQHLQTIHDFPIDAIRLCAELENRFRSNPVSMIRFYVWLAFGCLTSAFIMTQRNAAIRRIESSENKLLRERLLSRVLTGEWFTTVGISQLTTSRRHLSQPPLVAKPSKTGWTLSGYSPWVTGGSAADLLVLGAMEASPSHSSNVPQQLLFAIPTDRPGLTRDPGMQLIGLTASCTDIVHLDGVEVSRAELLHGPSENVLTAVGTSNSSTTASSGAGGLQTSALAIGHAAKAIEYLSAQSEKRPELRATVDRLCATWRTHLQQLLKFAAGSSQHDVLLFRKDANDLALQATQSALAAAKGAGYAADHEVGRWCCEALFFLVWSCPQPVIDAHLCSFSSLDTPAVL